MRHVRIYYRNRRCVLRQIGQLTSSQQTISLPASLRRGPVRRALTDLTDSQRSVARASAKKRKVTGCQNCGHVTTAT
eukprot:2978363-Rhodomonas_salina.3